MKKALLSIAIVLALAGGAHALTVGVAPTVLTVTPSTIFTIDMVVIGALPVDVVEGVNVEYYFSGQPVETLGWNEGDFMAQQAPEMPWGFTTVDNTLGIVSLSLVRLGSKYSTGSGTGATVTFHCTGPGVAVINYYVATGSQQGELVDASGQIIIHQGGGVIPEPMTLALVGVALTALGVVARRRS
mgnify:CR=1 FL=1